MLNNRGKLTRENDPLNGVSMARREPALEAVLKQAEQEFQIEAMVQLQMVTHELARTYKGNQIGEGDCFLMNQRIYRHVESWVMNRQNLGWPKLTVEEFIFEVKIGNENGHPTYHVDWPNVYAQLQQGTAPYTFVNLDLYTLHAMAKKWLDERGR